MAPPVSVETPNTSGTSALCSWCHRGLPVSSHPASDRPANVTKSVEIANCSGQGHCLLTTTGSANRAVAGNQWVNSRRSLTHRQAHRVDPARLYRPPAYILHRSVNLERWFDIEAGSIDPLFPAIGPKSNRCQVGAHGTDTGVGSGDLPFGLANVRTSPRSVGMPGGMIDGTAGRSRLERRLLAHSSG